MILERLNECLWAALFLPLFSLCGVTLLLRCRFLPFLRFRQMLRVTLGGREDCGEGLRPAQAAATALAATVGTGNIVGTAQAIAMGGPGAVFWLWIAALLGMSVKYAEILLGQYYRQGAMGYIRAALGKSMACFYAAASALSALAVGNMAQMNGSVSAVCQGAGESGFRLRLFCGLLLTVLVALSLTGGARRIGRLAERLVPIMALGFLMITTFVLFHFRASLPGVLQRIFNEAFHPQAAVGATSGAAIRQTVLWGLRRGAFSNEAGLGTAANVHATVDSRKPALHALWGVFEVFVDTLVLCTATALTILCSGIVIPSGSLPGPELLQTALAEGVGQRAASLFMAAALPLFGFTTVIGCAVCGERCVVWLNSARAVKPYRALFVLCAFLGSLVPTHVIWHAADAVNALLAVPNLLALLILAPQVGREVYERLYEKRASA